MPAFILLGVAAGLASAVLFASATTGSMLARFFLYFLAPLPCFLVGLGWGAGAAGIAGLAGSAALGLVLGLKATLVFFLSQGVPVAVLCHLALLNRQVAPSPTGGDVSSSPTVEWYPPGRIVAAATLMAGTFAFVSLVALSPDLEQLRALLRELIEKVFLKQLPIFQDRVLSESEISTLVEVALYTLPAATALSWFGGFLLNLWLAGRITLASGRLVRPWPDLAAMTFPPGFALGLAAALALSFFQGYVGFLASGFAGALFFAYLMMGLAIVHYVTRGMPARPFVLWGVYASLFILNTWAALALALVGIAEPVSPLRRRRSPGQPGPD